VASRRRFLRTSALAGASAVAADKLGWWQRVSAQIPGGTLPPDAVSKFVTPLVIPGAMPRAAADYYSIAVRQIDQQILPPPHPRTFVWAYGSTTDSRTFSYPARTIEAAFGRSVRVKWSNELVDANGRYLPHLLPVDQTLHWANPPGGISGRDDYGLDPAPYRGPVPIVTHLHGHHSTDESDGYSEAWYLPAATNIPAGFAAVGSWYEPFRAASRSRWNVDWSRGSSTFTYGNVQRATTLWYHDHALGLTRLNVYAGPVGFYLIRGGANDLPAGVLPGPAPAVGDTPGTSYYEIPLVIQDRSFDTNGALFYPDNRAFFEGLTVGQLQIPFIPQSACSGPSDVSPIWNPEFFGNMMVVNGRTWPYLTVEQRRYRFRFLNACDARFLILKMSRDRLPFWQIGSDGGFLPAPVRLSQLLVAPAERADVIVDFTNVPVGTEIVLMNLGPDEPFGGGVPDVDFDSADPGSTGQVMQFRVVAARSPDMSTPPDQLRLPQVSRLPQARVTRHVSINESESETVLVDGRPGHGRKKNQPPNLKLACDAPGASPFGPTHAMLGLVSGSGEGEPRQWMDPVTENPIAGDTEEWAIHNFTEDAHPIHLHVVQFEVIGRQDASGVRRNPEAWERGTKDVVIAYPGEITRVKATFDVEGRFVWHCHILEHEDNQMMRPLVVRPRT
jgi:FtsP/CotA-like multicopper oxidase with cupredoxin domain